MAITPQDSRVSRSCLLHLGRFLCTMGAHSKDLMPDADDNATVKTSKSKKRAAGNTDEAVAGGPKKAKAKEDIPLEIIIRSKKEGRDGRCCSLCNKGDGQTDFVLGEPNLIVWAYNPHIKKVVQVDNSSDAAVIWIFTLQGFFCFVCQRVFTNIYKCKYSSSEKFRQALGTDPALLREYKCWCGFVVEKEFYHCIKI